MSRFVRVVTLGCAVALLAPAIAAAQTIRGGVKGGIAFSDLSNLSDALGLPDGVDINMRTGWLLGGFVLFDINDQLAIQPEVLYAAKGATATDGTNELRIKLDYVDVPVLLRVTPVANHPFYLLVGPSINFNVSAKVESADDAGSTEDDVKEDVNGTEFGLVVGAGVTIGNFLVEGRYIAGLSNIADRPQNDESVRNRGFAFLAGVRF